jgi:hypothetical protein
VRIFYDDATLRLTSVGVDTTVPVTITVSRRGGLQARTWSLAPGTWNRALPTISVERALRLVGANRDIVIRVREG